MEVVQPAMLSVGLHCHTAAPRIVSAAQSLSSAYSNGRFIAEADSDGWLMTSGSAHESHPQNLHGMITLVSMDWFSWENFTETHGFLASKKKFSCKIFPSSKKRVVGYDYWILLNDHTDWLMVLSNWSQMWESEWDDSIVGHTHLIVDSYHDHSTITILFHDYPLVN